MNYGYFMVFPNRVNPLEEERQGMPGLGLVMGGHGPPQGRLKLGALSPARYGEVVEADVKRERLSRLR